MKLLSCKIISQCGYLEELNLLNLSLKTILTLLHQLKMDVKFVTLLWTKLNKLLVSP